jgi:hypothetical protein
MSVICEWMDAWHWNNSLSRWINNINGGIQFNNQTYPFISYGTDWLGFAHLVIAIVFIGPLKDPVKNKWIIEFGLIACLAIFPFALIAGEVRGIPMFWRMIDCTFGLVGGMLLVKCYQKIRKLEFLLSYENKR